MLGVGGCKYFRERIRGLQVRNLVVTGAVSTSSPSYCYPQTVISLQCVINEYNPKVGNIYHIASLRGLVESFWGSPQMLGIAPVSIPLSAVSFAVGPSHRWPGSHSETIKPVATGLRLVSGINGTTQELKPQS